MDSTTWIPIRREEKEGRKKERIVSDITSYFWLHASHHTKDHIVTLPMSPLN